MWKKCGRAAALFVTPVTSVLLLPGQEVGAEEVSLVSVCLKKHPDWCQGVRQHVSTSAAWPRLQEPWLPCFPVILVGAGFRGGGEAPVLLASPWGVTSKQPQVSSPSHHQHHKGRQPQDQPSRGCAVSLWQCTVHRGLQGSPPEARSPGCRELASSPAQGHRRPAPSPCAHTFQLRLKCRGLSPEPGRGPMCRKQQPAGWVTFEEGEHGPCECRKTGSPHSGAVGRGLGCDPRSRGAWCVQGQEAGLREPARGPANALWDSEPPGCGRVALRFVSQAALLAVAWTFALFLWPAQGRAQGLASSPPLRVFTALPGRPRQCSAAAGGLDQRNQEETAFLCPVLKAGVEGLLPAPAPAHGAAARS